MCGIFGYSGSQDVAAQIVLAGIKRLDYRGYDSWGVAAQTDGGLFSLKNVGITPDLDSLTDLPFSRVAIAHTRWATTGKVSKINAHPHLSSDSSFALAQNGIVDNYQEIKADLLARGYSFVSETDTEVVVRLIESLLPKFDSLRLATMAAIKKLQGRNTIILVTTDGKIVAARNGSPLVVGKNSKTQELFLSSDLLSFGELVDETMMLENNQLVEIGAGTASVYDVLKGNIIDVQFEQTHMENSHISKGQFPHFMLKEIVEGPEAVNLVIKSNDQLYPLLATQIKQTTHVYVIGSGGAGVAAAQVSFYLRDIGGVLATSLIGADALDYQKLFTTRDVIIAISQSGETADVLRVLEMAKAQGTKIASFVNMPGSMMGRMSDFPFSAHSGPEICVMSTKTFDAQLTFGYLLAHYLIDNQKKAIREIKQLVQKMTIYLSDQKNHNTLRAIAHDLIDTHDIFLLGKYQNYQIVREGMVKFVEATYKHAHALPAGDLKHYVITLMEPGVPVIVLVSADETKVDMVSAMDQVRLRGAHVIGIGSERLSQFDSYIPIPDCGPLSSVMGLLPLQLLAYYLAVDLGNSIDKPRNIAKSVTVL